MLFPPILLHGFRGGEALDKFSTLFLFVKTSLIDWALAGENGNKEFCRKRQVQVSNSPRSPQFRTKLIYCLLPDPPNFSLLSTFNSLINLKSAGAILRAEAFAL
jgi:hypothetical protein